MLKRLLLLSTILTLSACSSTYRSYYETLKLAFTTSPDAELSLEQVKNTEYDLLYVKHGERPQAVMALAFIEKEQHKWLSADNALLILEQGRIVRTAGLSNDLQYLTNTAADPLKQPLAQLDKQQWLRLADWQGSEYGYQIKSVFTASENEELTIYNKTFNTVKVTEQLEYIDKPVFWRVDTKWNNTFWFDQASGRLLKSQQQLSPFSEPFELLYVSQVARLID